MSVVSWLSNDNEVTKNKIRDDNIAPIELDALSASKTYAVGKPFILDSDGKLYKATEEITQGSPIITSGENANCEEYPGQILEVLESEKADKADLGTASTKDSTSSITENSTDLIESGAVYNGLASQQQLLEDTVGWNGKNILSNNMTSQTYRGVNITVNSDGSIKLNGSYTGTSFNAVNIYSNLILPKGAYKITGAQTGNNAKFVLQVYDNDNSAQILPSSTNYENFTLDTDTNVTIRIGFRVGGVADNLMIYPMLRHASITDPTYEPYHASVEESKADNSIIAPVENGATALQAYAVGSHAIRNGKFITWTNAKAQGETINDVSDYTSGDIAELLSYTISEPSNVNTKIALDSTRKTVVKYGNVVSLKVRFEVLESLGTDTVTLFTIPAPIIGNYLLNFYATSSPYAIDTSFTGYITGGGNLVIKLPTDISSGKFDVCGTYLCK